jgi:hypothetical protein
VFEAKDAERLAPFEDRRMWRLLLARLHPDAGGDHDLFAFACAVRDEVAAGGVRAAGNARTDDSRGPEDPAPFLRTWQDTMGHWSSTNRDALKNFWTG